MPLLSLPNTSPEDPLKGYRYFPSGPYTKTRLRRLSRGEACEGQLARGPAFLSGP